MVREKMNPRHISDLEKCSKDLLSNIKSLFTRAVAFFIAAALVSVPYPVHAEDNIKTVGLPQWLAPVAQRSLSEVWSSMDPQRSLSSRLEMMEIVASRLFDGYKVADIEIEESCLIMDLVPDKITKWKVQINAPSLRSPADAWFRDDIRGMKDRLIEIVRDVPVDSLSWADVALRRKINDVSEEYVLGWDPSILVNLSDHENELQVRFSGEQPLVLAFKPEIESSSIPVIFRSDLRETMLKDLYVFNGLPVLWLERHKVDLQRFTRQKLLERNTVENSRAEVSVKFEPAQIASVRAEVESQRYSASARLVVPVGAEERYPELHLHLGRIVQPAPFWDLEIYAEFITGANDLDIETRWGAGWKPWKQLWVGAEYSSQEDTFWWKCRYSPSADSPYIWLRYSETDLGIIGAGWPLNQYFSIELNYDERYEDSFNVRIISEL